MWHMQSRHFGLVAKDIDKLIKLSTDLLEKLMENLHEKCGKQQVWKLEKAHSILHKWQEIYWIGWSENFSTQVSVMQHSCV